jgi:hypothetical protein
VLVVACLGCRTPTTSGSVELEEVAIRVRSVSNDERRLCLEVLLPDGSPASGELAVLWSEGVSTSARLVRGIARVSLPSADALIPAPVGPAPPGLSEVSVELRGRAQRGRATVKLDADPAADALRLAIREAHGVALGVHRDAWRADHQAELDALVEEAAGLAEASTALDLPIPRGRGPADADALADLSARCLRVRPALERLQPRIEAAEAAWRGDLPGLPETLATAALVGTRRADLGWACERVTRGIEGAAKRAEAAAAEGAERARLKKSRRARRAVSSVELVEEILRSAAGDDLLNLYEDALEDWQDAETRVLRLRRGDPAESKEAVASAAEARENAGAVNSMISLTLSGRSGQLADAVFAAAKRLKTLGEADRKAVLGLFSRELTPASRVLNQLLRDRL